MNVSWHERDCDRNKNGESVKHQKRLQIRRLVFQHLPRCDQSGVFWLGPLGHILCACCNYHQNPKLKVEACLKCYQRRQGFIDYLSQCDDLKIIEEITYKQWVSTDRTTLVTIVESKEDFIENLSTQIKKLTRHAYTAKAHSLYMKTVKASMTPLQEIIVQGDFAENFSYVVQDEIQSSHCENKQATLHPFFAYNRKEDGTLEHIKNIKLW